MISHLNATFEGFDVVIGNPPYIQFQSMNKDIKAQYEDINYETFTATGDIYTLFYELAIRLSKDQVGMITSNKWMRAKYGQKLRKLLLSKNISHLIDFNGSRVFPEASVDTNILIISIYTSQKSYFYDVKGWVLDQKLPSINLYEVLQTYQHKELKKSEDNFVFVDDNENTIIAKIEQGQKLSEWNISIFIGVLTGLNDAFYIDENQYKAFIDQDVKNKEILYPVLHGEDTEKFVHKGVKRYIIGTYPAKKVNIDNYPVIKKYLEKWYNRLQQTGKGKGITRKKTNYQWFETQDTIGYYAQFNEPKLIYGEIVQYPRFCYSEDKEHVDGSAFIMVGKHLKWIMALLNSSLLEYSFNHFYSGGKLGQNGFRYKKAYLLNLPILVPTSEQEAYVVSLVDKIIEAKQAGLDSLPLEQELDDYIFTLYNLTDEEIKTIKKIVKSIKKVNVKKKSNLP